MNADGRELLVREVHIDASPEIVFAFFVDADKLTRWLATEATLDPRPGGGCVQVHGGSDDGRHGPVHMRGTFLEVDPPTRVVFSWGFVEPECGVLPASSTVEVVLQPEGSGTRLRLTHRGLPPSAIEDHRRGWKQMLDRLQQAITPTTVRPTGGRRSRCPTTGPPS